MKNNKVTLKKISKENNSTVRVLTCHCGCEGQAGKAWTHGYLGQYL
ncbi:lachnocin family radical SAM-modified peptide [Roseburia sp. TF10-5]